MNRILFPASLSARLAASAVVCAAAALGTPAAAERADRGKPMEVLADKSGSADRANQVTRVSGNVVLTQGTLGIRADRVELRQTPEGYYSGTAWGVANAPVRYRQKRDGINEWVEAEADRVEIDGKNDLLRFIGNARLRRLRGNEVVDEVSGPLLTWNNSAEVFTAQGSAGASASAPAGRVRLVLTPQPAASASR